MQEKHGTPFTQRPYHRRWLLDQARDLLNFFGTNAPRPDGGFYNLTDDGRPLPDDQQELFLTCRMVHCFAIGDALGHPGAMDIVDHGMRFLLERHYDPVNGGFFWGVDQTGATQPTKRAYGHAFVLLAAASAQEVGHPQAPRLRDLAMQAIDTHFWEPDIGAMCEEFSADWTERKPYRGQNANMHGVEALMAAFEAFGDHRFLTMAQQIAELVINQHARAAGWVVIEHFHADWTPDRGYAGDPMFGPSGTTPGHALEWSRLLIQLWFLGGQKDAWMPEAASALFHTACATGWLPDTGGFCYTLDFDNQPDQKVRIWWPACEGVAAAAVLQSALDDTNCEPWYRDIWSVLARDYIDPGRGWFPVARGDTEAHPFVGKPDIYHALQACVIPLTQPQSGVFEGLRTADPKTF